MCRGENSEEKWKAIDSIDDYYNKEIQRQAFEEATIVVREEVRNLLNPVQLDVDEEAIAIAIERTVNTKVFTSRRDWAGIYIILTSRCGWDNAFKRFECEYNKLVELYPRLRRLPSKKAFDYQGLQQGLSIEWPNSYSGWLTCTIKDNTFIHRKAVADAFLECLTKTLSNKRSY